MFRYTFHRMNNFTYITNSRFNRTLLFVLVTAFLSMQWLSPHIHLAEHHDHSGNHHQHEIEAHAHQSITHDDHSSSTFQSIDNHNLNVVEIDHQQRSTTSGDYNDHFITSTPDNFHLSFIPLKSSIESTALSRSKLPYLDYSTIFGRAPPNIS
jgi:hypothetical protein